MIQPLRIVALDLGIAHAGIAVTHDQVGQPRLSCRTITTRKRDNRPTLMDHERAHEVIGAVMAAVACKPDVVVIEEPIQVEGKGVMSVRLGEIHGAVKHYLWSQRIPYVDVHLTRPKVYATGNGAAKKPAMLEAVIARYGRFLNVHGYDAADAVAMLAMALDAYGQPLAEVPAHHRKAVTATTWPELASA